MSMRSLKFHSKQSKIIQVLNNLWLSHPVVPLSPTINTEPPKNTKKCQRLQYFFITYLAIIFSTFRIYYHLEVIKLAWFCRIVANKVVRKFKSKHNEIELMRTIFLLPQNGSKVSKAMYDWKLMNHWPWPEVC